MPRFEDIFGDTKGEVGEHLSMEECVRLATTNREMRTAVRSMLDQTFERRLTAAAELPFWQERGKALAGMGWAFDLLPAKRQTQERRYALAAAINRFDGPATALHEAAMRGQAAAVGQLMRHGAQVDAQTIGYVGQSRSETALHMAAFQGHKAVAQLLLDGGASVNALNIDGATPLHKAARGGNLDTVRLLSDKGANIHAMDLDDENVLMSALMGGSPDVVQLLMDRGAKWSLETTTVLHVAGSPAVVDMVLQRGAQVDAVDWRGQTALHDAAAQGRLDLVQRLLDHFARVDVRDKNGKTPLDLVHDRAIRAPEYEQIIRLLREAHQRQVAPDMNGVSDRVPPAQHKGLLR